ncbi:AsmA-like C-terminal region-containing protein [Aestuariivirga sp.]|uniref:AsmA family protein n=1 Tax=Aestuariivirga sp. TaxID=2650926 RepID=UPI0037848CD4
MDRRGLMAVGAAVALIAVATVVWVVLSPGWVVPALGRIAEQQLGRAFSSTGRAHLDFSPLSLRIEQPVLAGLTEASAGLLSGGTLVIPVSFGQILSRKPDLTRISLSESEFALLIDERGQASWDFPEAAAGQELAITLKQASFRYFDARNGQALTLSNVDGLMRITPEGGVTFTGTAVIKSQVAHIDLELRSLPRVNAGGSPLEVVIESGAASVSFSGRLSTGKVLNLAGPLSLSTRETATLARWAGIPLAEGTSLPEPLNLDGALDSAGRAFAIRNAAVTLGQFRAAGDVVADLRGERPKLQANLQAETLWLDALLPSAGAGPEAWGRAVFPVQALRAMDAELSIIARTVAFNGFTGGVTRFAATVTDGKIESSGAARLDTGGTASFRVQVDSAVLPPSGIVGITAENAGLGPLIGALTGVTALSGTGNLNLELSAQGQTQEELVSTLKGAASLSLNGGQLAGSDIGGTIAAVRERILDGWTTVPGGTPVDSLSATASLADGLATLGASELATPGLRMSLSGTVDLLRRALDLKAELLPPETAPLPVPVIVQGNWAAPRIYPDIPDILNNPEGGFARLRSDKIPPGN